MKSPRIPFNKPHLTGKETDYICDAVSSGKISGNGKYTKKCHQFFEEKYDFKKCFLTTSCTDALEMAAILMNIKPGDEIILPSFTYVSTANAFMLHGATLVFADSSEDNPNLDTDQVESLITPKTKAIVVVHYAGVSCDMDLIMELAERHNLLVVEDAAQSIDSYHNGKPLGGIGHFGTFSFHETKNVISGEGGMLVINDDRFVDRAEIIWEKGTNRAAFFRGEVDKYEWVDLGSSFLPSEVIAAFLYAQLEQLEDIQSRRADIWKTYSENLSELCLEKNIQLPNIPEYASNNANMFYLVLPDVEARKKLISRLGENDILAVFHYQSLHNSEFFKSKSDGRELVNSDRYSDCLLRLPFYYALTKEEQYLVIDTIKIALNSY
ncbi:MAG: dTDP-4-amino-4,6-dideoxygalactose transaminase [Crocinitomicaceae bacterium]|nr:dTDP-4-amino-4,6-dideoxygalactose transaminase [Flavobacteriales bacterium]NQZ37289.1 dTDP-4-amino-4,6-dideoxygalactose transaminase [Crocinitomicaceae bacterium]